MSDEKVTELTGCGGTAMPNEVRMQNTINQLRANAKSHKKRVDGLREKVSQLTIENDKLKSEKKKATAGELAKYALITVLFGFLATIGGICAYGWSMAISALIN